MKRIVIGLMALMVAAVAGAQDYPSKTMIGVITGIDPAGPGRLTVITPTGEQKFSFDMASDVIVEGQGIAGRDALKVGLPVRITASGDAIDSNVDEIEVLNASDADYAAAMALAPAVEEAMPDVAAAPMEEEVVVEEVMVEETFVATSLPKTASPVPLLGLVGVAALAGAALLRRFRP